MGKRIHPPISIHQTLHGQIEVNWDKDYHQEFNCPECEEKYGKKNVLHRYKRDKRGTCKLVLGCKYCETIIYLTSREHIYITSYLRDTECPNPLCTGVGHNGQRGWIYKLATGQCKCRFCETTFTPKSTHPSAWVNVKAEKKLSPFCFDENVWDLRHFYEKPKQKTFNFSTIQPLWFQVELKKYIYYTLKSRRFSSVNATSKTITTLKQLGKVLADFKIKNKNTINRKIVVLFIDSCKGLKNETINTRLTHLKEFFDWLELETSALVRRRDYLKISKNDSDWLDEVTRKTIKYHLDKIPAPIARHYLIQAYIAARPSDVCQMTFDCLTEENGKWYVKFAQGKVNRWHRILVTRKIKKIIEEQQEWIKEVFGKNYSYLFCHFRRITPGSYPSFPNIKPLPQPPKTDVSVNPMVRIIRMLIEKENVLDANGQKPHFVGKITRSSRLQEVRAKYGMKAAQLYANHKSSNTTFQHYAPPTREQIAKVDLPFQKLLLNPDNKFLPWQSLPESLLQNPKAHELDLEIAPRLVVYGHCALNPKTPCPVNLFPKCYGCSSFRPSTGKLPLYERQYQGEQLRLTEAEQAGAELAHEEAKATIEAMDKWLPELRRLANG